MLHSSGNYPVLCSDPDGKEIQNRGSMYIHVTDSFYCTEEHYIVKQIYSSKILIEKKKRMFLRTHGTTQPDLLSGIFQ